MISIVITILEFLTIYLGWLSLPVVVGCIWLIKKRRYTKRCSGFLLLSLLFIWAHFVEPYIILVKQKTIMVGVKADIILIADVHLGYYKDQRYLQRIVDKVNGLEADYVVIAGDFLYKANEPLDKLFAPLAKINKPVYAVRGNHDYHYLRTNAPESLLSVLQKNNVQLIEHKVVDFGDYQLAGLGDRYEHGDYARFLEATKQEKPTVMLAHNPDSADRLAAYKVPLLLAGHTHCGQIKIPFLYKYAIRSQYSFTCGLSTFDNTQVFITPGLGEVNLPLRLFNPPTINVLHLR